MSQPLPRSEAVMELLPLYLSGEQIFVTLLGGSALEAGWHASAHPNEVAVGLCREFGLDPIVVHSTSWRHQPGKLTVTYAAVLAVPGALAPMLQAIAVSRSDLARGDAVRAPAVIGVEQVVEHALRHLAWLAVDDEQVRAALPSDWVTALTVYPPEPFRSFESGW